MGFGAKAVVTGDPTQVDLPRGSKSGLAEAQEVLAEVRGFAMTRFTADDVVRHPLVGRIVAAYEAHTAKQPADGRSDVADALLRGGRSRLA
jgi:phosphate starvation-inducible PhoH-like protein